MKNLLSIISAFAFCFPVSCPATYFYSVSGTSYTVNENFEGTGTASGWTDTGIPDWDYATTPAPLADAQSWFSTLGADQSVITVADSNTYTSTCMFRAADVTPTATATIVSLRTSALVAVCMFRIRTDGGISVYTNALDSTTSVDKMAINTTYYCKMIWVDGGTCSAEFSTTGTFTGSGNKYTSRTGGTTTDCTLFRIGSSTNGGLDDVIVDNVQLWVP